MAPIVVRTRLYDEALQREGHLSQAVMLAAGMDARSYRLPWPDGATVFEVDQPRVIAIKDERIAGERPRCRRVAVGVGLADDWPKELCAQGFDPTTSEASRRRRCPRCGRAGFRRRHRRWL